MYRNHQKLQEIRLNVTLDFLNFFCTNCYEFFFYLMVLSTFKLKKYHKNKKRMSFFLSSGTGASIIPNVGLSVGLSVSPWKKNFIRKMY